jgi:uncharacterized membrane protein (UPF0127 family)
VADEPEERAQGLRGVTRLPADVDGMLFVFAEPVSTAFIMEDTLLPLDVWFFDGAGLVVGTEEMTPCSVAPCPRHGSPGLVRWALETPLGRYEFGEGELLSASP